LPQQIRQQSFTMEEHKFIFSMHATRKAFQSVDDEVSQDERNMATALAIAGANELDMWYPGAVEVRPSEVHGRGVFAAHHVEAGRVVAIFPAHETVSRRSLCGTSTLAETMGEGKNVYRRNVHENLSIWGDPAQATGAAVAHFVNDPCTNVSRLQRCLPDDGDIMRAMFDYVLKTGRDRNCVLVHGSEYCYLRTTVAVAAGTELLAAYGFGYWLPQHLHTYNEVIHAHIAAIPPCQKSRWLKVLRAIQEESEPVYV
jgi:hypothetical protein